MQICLFNKLFFQTVYNMLNTQIILVTICQVNLGFPVALLIPSVQSSLS